MQSMGEACQPKRRPPVGLKPLATLCAAPTPPFPCPHAQGARLVLLDMTDPPKLGPEPRAEEEAQPPHILHFPDEARFGERRQLALEGERGKGGGRGGGPPLEPVPRGLQSPGGM